METHRRYVAYSSPALPQHWPENLRDSKAVLGDSNRKSSVCDHWRLFSLAEFRDGWQYGPGASLCLPLSAAQEGIVQAVFMPGWHCVDVVQLLTCWAAWLQFTFLPLLPPFLHFSLSPLHLALRPRLYHQKWGSPFSVAQRLRDLLA